MIKFIAKVCLYLVGVTFAVLVVIVGSGVLLTLSYILQPGAEVPATVDYERLTVILWIIIASHIGCKWGDSLITAIGTLDDKKS